MQSVHAQFTQYAWFPMCALEFSCCESMFRLFEWIYGANNFVLIHKWTIFEGNIIE